MDIEMKAENALREVQLTQLRILKVFMQFCEDHNLRWYMIGGSLIGVLRHKGFIPWDDDIDIGMPRKDYDEFVALQNTFPDGYTLTDRRNDAKWHFNFSQFVDAESEIIVHMNEKPRPCKIWIDVFPIDGMPENSFRRWLHGKHVLMYRYMIQMAKISTQVDTHKVGRPWFEKTIIKMLHYVPVGKLVNVDRCLDNMARVLRRYDFDDSAWAGNMLGKYREKEYMPKSWWGVPVKLPFEDISVLCPAESDKIETKLYGDYMQWPAVGHRVSHDIEIIKLRDSGA